MTIDLFEHTVLCSKCDKKMKKIVVNRNGFNLRALECPECGQRTYHPSDLEEFHKYSQLKNQNFKVKLRQVGNSYAVSIPRELLDFFSGFDEERNEMNNVHKIHEKMERMVTLALEQANKLSLSFGGADDSEDQGGVKERNYSIERNGIKTMVHEKSQVKHINTNHTKGFIARKVKVMKSVPKREERAPRFDEEEDLE